MSNDGRRDHLLSAGVDLLKARPYQEVSIEEIARAAGVSKGLLYHYFPTKRDFILAALRRGRGEMAKLLAPNPELAPIKRLDASLDAYLDFVAEHSAAFAAIFRASGADREVDAAIEEGRNAYRELLIASIVEWPEAPVATERTPLLEGAVQGWIFFCEGAVLRWLEGGDIDRHALRIMLRNTLGGAVFAAASAAEAEAAWRAREAAREDGRE
jgi:AcrR family transcriptional regulator